MKSPRWSRRLVPSVLGAAMLAVIIVAALTPNVGVVSAQVNAQYTSVTTGPTTLEYALIGVLVAAIVAAIVGLMIFQRRKKGGQGGVAAWQDSSGGGRGPGTGGSGLGPDEAVGAGAVAGGGLAAAAASYDETAPAPAETGPEWAEPEAPATMGSAGGAVAPPIDESEPDIDRLMKELDQISDDILKKTPPKKGQAPEQPSDDDADAGQ